MTLKHSVGLQNFCLSTGFATAFDTDGRIDIYTGSQPATGDTAASGTKLGTLALGSDAFGTPSAGAVAANSITNDSAADNSGTPGYFMFYKTGDTAPGSTGNGSTDLRLTGTIAGKNQLNGAINNSVTTITLADTTHLASSGEVIIDSERITYSGKTGTTLTGCTRGANSTAAASHSDAAVVKQYGYDMHFDNIAFVAGGVISISGFTYTYAS